MVANTLVTLGDRGSFAAGIQGQFFSIVSKEEMVRNQALASKTGKKGGKQGENGGK